MPQITKPPRVKARILKFFLVVVQQKRLHGTLARIARVLAVGVGCSEKAARSILNELIDEGLVTNVMGPGIDGSRLCSLTTDGEAMAHKLAEYVGSVPLLTYHEALSASRTIQGKAAAPSGRSKSGPVGSQANTSRDELRPDESGPGEDAVPHDPDAPGSGGPRVRPVVYPPSHIANFELDFQQRMRRRLAGQSPAR